MMKRTIDMAVKLEWMLRDELDTRRITHKEAVMIAMSMLVTFLADVPSRKNRQELLKVIFDTLAEDVEHLVQERLHA